MTISPSQLAAENSPAIYPAAFRTSFLNAPPHQAQHVPVNWTTGQGLDVPGDIVVQVGGISFSLHRFPLTSRCGLLKMLVVEERSEARVELDGVPGGAEGFELAAKFCYGACVEISKHNVALLRCVAEFLDMSEEHGENNLVSQTESYLERLPTKTFKDIVATLQSCETLLPLAEDLKIVNRCINWAAAKAVLARDAERDCHTSLLALHDLQHNTSPHLEWWVEDLSALCMRFFQQVLAAMREKGLSPEGVGGALVFYAQKFLVGMQIKKNSVLWDSSVQASKSKGFDASTAMKREQRILVETLVSLLPKEKGVASINFLIGLLRTACMLETTLACRLDLEKRIGVQLHKATLDDLLIPSPGKYDGETLFDVDIVHRLVASFVEQQGEDDVEDNLSEAFDDADGLSTAPSRQNPVLKVAKLLDGYLAEIAPDANLSLSKFIALAELIPEYARPVEDGLYRAIDVYLKAHPSLKDVERKKLCRLLDFQKLSQEICTHAAQNERLPVQAVVQVLYFEQLRIRNVMAGAYHLPELTPTGMELANSNYAAQNAASNSSNNANVIHKISNGTLSASLSPKDHYASVRRENRELKLEVARMRMRLSDLEKDHLHMKLDMEKTHFPHHSSSHHNHHHGFFHAFSKSISKLNPFHHHKLGNHHNQHISRPHKSHSQPEPHRRPSSHFDSSTSSSQASSFENPRKDHSTRRKRHSLS
ncbi:hypothetical protein L7F22_037180 [Adiantum nelumboides]|nr:hypothetical protein [Adiantum nelumboides]